MNCQQVTNCLDDYLDGALETAQRVRFDEHVADCTACQAVLAQARELQVALKGMSVPAMSPGFAQQAIKRAAQRQDHRRGFAAGFATAMVAGVAMMLVVGGYLPNVISPASPLTEVAITVDQPQTVNLVFNAAHAMENATLSIELPEHVEVIGFPGQRSLSWQASLQEGKNILPLPIRGLARSDGELLASIEQQGRRKAIRVHIRVDGQAPRVLMKPVSYS